MGTKLQLLKEEMRMEKWQKKNMKSIMEMLKLNIKIIRIKIKIKIKKREF